jgi:hypothetical protein
MGMDSENASPVRAPAPAPASATRLSTASMRAFIDAAQARWRWRAYVGDWFYRFPSVGVFDAFSA